MYNNTEIVASTGGAVTDASALRMQEMNGCWDEARRADKVSSRLLNLRSTDELGDCYESITTLLKEVETSSDLLRDLYDLSAIYQSRFPYIYYYLKLILPSMSKSMRDMLLYIDNEGLSTRLRWTLMEGKWGDGEMALVKIFQMYRDALIQIIGLLSRSSTYDPTTLEDLRLRLLCTRRHQGLPEPKVQIYPHLAPSQPNLIELKGQKRHWAEKIFDDQPHSTTILRHQRNSQCFGPSMTENMLGIPLGSQVLFKLPFDKNLLSVTFYLQGSDVTRLLCRWMDPYSNPLYSSFGVQELCVRRKGAALQFRRWSDYHDHPIVWAALFFTSWERMVLFHSAFVALKSRCTLTVRINPDEYKLSGEVVLFKEQIIDDRFEHSLSVIRDEKSGSLRLHAAVRNGQLKSCPVWTAFITYQSKSPQWMERKGHRIIIKDIKLYVFCENYKKKRQMTKNGRFEILFVERKAAKKFEDCLHSDDGSGCSCDDGGPGPSGGGHDSDKGKGKGPETGGGGYIPG